MIGFFIYTLICKFCVYIIDLLQMVDFFHRVSLHLIWNKVLVHPILTCFVGGGRLSCLYQPGEAPACHFDSLFLKPIVFQDICISCGSFMKHAKWATKTAWSSMATLCWFWSSPSSIFMCSQQRAGLKKPVHPFLMVSPPLCHLHCYLWVSKSCFTGCQSFSCGDSDSRMAGDHLRLAWRDNLNFLCM